MPKIVEGNFAFTRRYREDNLEFVQRANRDGLLTVMCSRLRAGIALSYRRLKFGTGATSSCYVLVTIVTILSCKRLLEEQLRRQDEGMLLTRN